MGYNNFKNAQETNDIITQYLKIKIWLYKPQNYKLDPFLPIYQEAEPICTTLAWDVSPTTSNNIANRQFYCKQYLKQYITPKNNQKPWIYAFLEFKIK